MSVPDGFAVDISTHSLTKRLTEGDRVLLIKLNISTHSLTKRLTPLKFYKQTDKGNFNSQPHEEADDIVSTTDIDL